MRPSGVLRIAPEVELTGKRYAGRKTTRKEMQLERQPSPESSESDDSDEGFGDAVFDQRHENVDDHDDDEHSDGSGALPEASNDERDGDEDDQEDSAIAEDEDDQIDTSGIMEAMAAAQRAELAKAKAVEKQVWQFQRALALRIKLQAALTACNKLPLRRSTAATEKEDGRWDERGSAAAAAEISRALGDIARLSGVTQSPPPSSASLEVWWHWIDHSLNAPRVAADEALVEEWNRRTDTSLGANGGRAFKALGRPVMEQIRYALRNDMGRLVKRSQLNRGQAVPLGTDAVSAPEYLDNIYDDGDFYGQLLKTFIEASTSAAESALSGPRVLRQQKARRMTRDEKRRRKLQAEMGVKQELMNFMAPLASTQLPAMAAPLFGSLFG